MSSSNSKPKTIFEKIWDTHVVKSINPEMNILYIDKHLIHDVTSPQAFESLRQRGKKVFRPKQTLATADHNIPTKNQHLEIKDQLSKLQVNALKKNCEEAGIEFFNMNHPNNGIVHVIGPELGMTLPGMTIVCGDSHTSTHGAFGAIAFGIGTTEIEQVLASQCLLQSKPKTMNIKLNGDLQNGVSAKDIILYFLSQLTSSGGTGYFIEYTGSTIDQLSMEGRMTLCNMTIEMGARGGLIAPDEKTFNYIENRRDAPKGKEFDESVAYWKTLATEPEATYDETYTFNAAAIEPMITYGTNPGMSIKISDNIPDPINNKMNPKSFSKAIEYMGLTSGMSLLGHKIDYVFVGSCTNSRIEDMRVVANFVKGRKKSENVTVWIVPGSKKVLQKLIEEGLDTVFENAGFELRGPGCSACLGMNEDQIPPGKYCVSTSNRNFEGRQGQNARTFLASPLMAAAAAIFGEITDVRKHII